MQYYHIVMCKILKYLHTMSLSFFQSFYFFKDWNVPIFFISFLRWIIWLLLSRYSSSLIEVRKKTSSEAWRRGCEPILPSRLCSGAHQVLCLFLSLKFYMRAPYLYIFFFFSLSISFLIPLIPSQIQDLLFFNYYCYTHA